MIERGKELGNIKCYNTGILLSVPSHNKGPRNDGDN